MADERIGVLQEALNITTGDRQADYGDPVETHQRIADIFEAMTGHRLEAHEVALFHIATKLARIKANPAKRDSFVDIAAYAAIAHECIAAE